MVLKKAILTALAFILVTTACQPPTLADNPAPSPVNSPVPVFGTTLTLPTPPPLLTSFPIVLRTPITIDSSSIPMKGIFTFPDGVNPLTGLPVSDPVKLNRRPVLIKVSNFPPSGRPHAGLSFADIVFEYYIGEYTNRFLALYYGQDTPKAWPLRSGRYVDPQLTTMYQGVLVYGNADPRVDEVIVRVLGDRALSFNTTPCPPVCGTATHSATGVYVDSAATSDFAERIGIDNSRPNLNGMVFSDIAPPSDRYGVDISVQYIRWNRGEWHYEPETHQYLRWIESWDSGTEYPMIPLVDQVTGNQLSFSNLIIIFATYTEFNPTLHNIAIWDNTAGQRAVYFRDGLMYEGIWKTISPEQPIRFLDQWGLPMALKPGNSWIVIAGVNSDFNELSTGVWEMDFELP